MRNYIILSTLVLCLFFSCKLPEQPALSSKESNQFKKIEEQYKAKVKREISPDYLRKLSTDAKYLLEINDIECAILDSINLEEKAKEIAHELYFTTLGKEAGYIDISIVFNCNTGVNQLRSKSFDFKTKDL